MNPCTRYGRHVLIPTLFLAAMVAMGIAPAETGEDRILLPIGETAEVLQSWWKAEGYEVRRIETKTGFITFHAVKGVESWQVDLAPHSPLATRVMICFSGENPAFRRKQLMDHLSGYVTPTTAAPRHRPGNGFPMPVLSRIESVVCINARSDEKDIQFSGFIVDPEGLVLCTAHDLQDVGEVTVTLYDGREIAGEILFRDKRQDLSLIQISLKTNTAIKLSEGRNLLGMGEMVFTVGCPVNLRGTIYSGTINGPPRLVNDLPLWQVDMEVYPGSSGSPVFDADGNLVAVVKGRYRGTSTTGFLIPLETVINFLKENSPL